MVDEKPPTYWEKVQASRKDIETKSRSGYYDQGNYFKKCFNRAFIPLMIGLIVLCGLLEYFLGHAVAWAVGSPGLVIVVVVAWIHAKRAVNKKFGEPN